MPYCYVPVDGVCGNEASAASCATEGGMVVATCPTAGLVGCCAYGAGTEVCDYGGSGNSEGVDQAACTSEGGTWTGSGTAVCNPPAGQFSSADGLTAASCVAQVWRADAVLVRVEFGQYATLAADGDDASWAYVFGSPSTPCPIAGDSGDALLTIAVTSSAATGSGVVVGVSGVGRSCGTVTALTGEADSTAVVSAAAALIMPMVPSGSTVTWSASDPPESTTQVGTPTSTLQVWSVEAYWTVAGGDFYEVSETFDASGANPTTAMIGPCDPTTDVCQ